MDSLGLLLISTYKGEVFPQVTFRNKGSAGVVIKAPVKQAQTECELAFISARSKLGSFLEAVDKGTGG